MLDKLPTCDCGGFLPRGASACPHCDRALPRWLRGLATLVAGSAAAMTLSACYGGACVEGTCYGTYPDEPISSPCDAPAEDTDGDGYCGEHDCDETDPTVQVCASTPPR